ncbi:hypothetical protein [Paracidobacterium acidisoli]|uniref:DUF3806 domain-containing protein n=1 Tax=Paracidobacterium acidisoli TaxID=2303751 RepID=A0A372IMC4_9BACT|nr:hypothetical protein [Paracidobacterium acidisoli]MBT9331678.1 hypothetical protein [Paracidobacterium acidisoli]
MSGRDVTAGRTFNSLGAMMQAWADEAVRVAQEEYGMELDYAEESVAKLDTVLAARIPVAADRLDRETRMWGGYFGEIFRRRYDAEWIMAMYPNKEGRNEMAMPALDVDGSQVYPLLKVDRRLTMGPAEELNGFFVRVTKALDGRTQKS